MPKRVFVTGGSGFVGQSVVAELLRRGFEVNALSRSDSQDKSLAGARIIRGDLFDAKSLDAGVAGCDAVVHLVGIIMEKRSKGITFERIHFEGAKNVVDATKRAGVRRYVHMSALGTRPNAVSEYHKSKWKAEEYVRASGLDFTILRPSMIHGPRGEFMQMEAKWAKKQAPPFLFMPYFGAGFLGLGGAGKLQPVYVEDVARAFVDSIQNSKTIGQTYELAGPDELTWPELHRAVARAIVGKPRLVIPIPVWKAKVLASIVPSPLLTFNHDQVIMSQEDNTAPLDKVVADFAWTPRPFEETLRSYAEQLREA